jgi:phosphohistidine phosphatase SixA
VTLYLVQHGDAKSEAEDPERPLTERGRSDVARLAALLARTTHWVMTAVVPPGITVPP